MLDTQRPQRRSSAIGWQNIRGCALHFNGRTNLVEPIVRAGPIQLLLGQPEHAAGDVARVESRPEHRNPPSVGAQVPAANLGAQKKQVGRKARSSRTLQRGGVAPREKG